MPALGLFFLLATATVVALYGVGSINRAAFAHGVFAVAALPLMLGAIQHFVPVLTRSGAPARSLALLPWLAAGGGVLAVTGVAGGLPRHALLLAALLEGACVATMIVWVVLRGRRCLGAPHPGVRWYLAALGFLLLGMAAVFGMVLDTASYPAWRAVHLHVNLLGWIGLTALGTLPVLLPTNLQKNDPDAAQRLRRLLGPAIFGVLLLAAGSGLNSGVLALFGAVLYAAVPAVHLRVWSVRYGFTALRRGVALSLTLAMAGLIGLLVAGTLHGFGVGSGAPLVGGFVLAFLLPLVLGALAQLLPVWRYPGPETAARVTLQTALARHAGGRGLACLLAALLHLAGFAWAPLIAAGAVAQFLATLLVVRCAAKAPSGT